MGEGLLMFQVCYTCAFFRHGGFSVSQGWTVVKFMKYFFNISLFFIYFSRNHSVQSREEYSGNHTINRSVATAECL